MFAIGRMILFKLAIQNALVVTDVLSQDCSTWLETAKEDQRGEIPRYQNMPGPEKTQHRANTGLFFAAFRRKIRDRRRTVVKRVDDHGVESLKIVELA